MQIMIPAEYVHSAVDAVVGGGLAWLGKTALHQLREKLNTIITANVNRTKQEISLELKIFFTQLMKEHTDCEMEELKAIRRALKLPDPIH